MSEHTPPTGFGPIADELLPHATRRGIHALWQAEGSRQYIDGIVTQTDAYLGDIALDIVAARTAYEDAIAAFTGEEACVLADRLDAEEQAVDFLPVISGDISQAADAITTLFQKSLFIATESAGDQFQQRVSEAETIREEARSMTGGATIAVNALGQIADHHPNVDQDEISSHRATPSGRQRASILTSVFLPREECADGQRRTRPHEDHQNHDQR